MEKTEITNSMHPSLNELNKYHLELSNKYKEVNVVPTSNDELQLMAFNGYYSMSETPGAFFTIDTNMYVSSTESAPIYDISFIVSLDGKTSTRIPFTGSFDGTELIQDTKDYGISLIFTRNTSNGSDTISPTVLLSGTIIHSKTPYEVSGQTYNNPIPYSTYTGVYYKPSGTFLQKKGDKIENIAEAVPVLGIEDNYKLLYDYGMNNGDLQPVLSYSYNFNMFVFTLGNNKNVITNLIMGTSASGGLVCSDMTTVKNSSSKARSLQSIPFPEVLSPGIPINSADAEKLASYAGYYPLFSSVPINSFVSIQANRVVNEGKNVGYDIMIGLSKDGISAKVYSLSSENVTFENDILTINESEANPINPDPIIIKFNRSYKKGNLVKISLSGMYPSITAYGYSPFNSVPLSGFKGVPMTSSGWETLVINNDTCVTYNGQTIESFIYVPLMYVLGTTTGLNKPELEMSFGTHGASGSVCIVTDYVTADSPEISYVQSIIT